MHSLKKLYEQLNKTFFNIIRIELVHLRSSDFISIGKSTIRSYYYHQERDFNEP